MVKVCMQAFDNQVQCDIDYGIVELVRRDEAILFYDDTPPDSVGLFLKEKKLYHDEVGYTINHVGSDTPQNMSFLNVEHAHANFTTPCTSTSYIVLAVHVPERVSFKKNYDAGGTIYSRLNHVEYLIEKYALIVPVNRNQYPKTIPVVVKLVYYVSMDVHWTGDRGSVTFLNHLNQTSVLTNTDETKEYKDVLKRMGGRGWLDFMRTPLDKDPHLEPVPHKCSLNPTTDNDLPNCNNVIQPKNTKREEL